MQWIFYASECLVLVSIFSLFYTDATNSCEKLDTDVVRLIALLETDPSDGSNICAYDDAVTLEFALSVALTAEYVIEQVNNNMTDLAVPGITYDLKVEGICNNGSYATRAAALNTPLSLWTDNQFCASEESAILLGLIGPTLSATAPSVARFMNKMQIPVITPSATLVELADKTKYGSLLRTVPSDDKQSKALVDLAKQMEWSYIVLVHSDDDYGIQGAAEIESYGTQRGLCISDKISTKLKSSDNDHYGGIASRLLSFAATGIIYFGQASAFEQITDHYLSGLRGSTIQRTFLASDGIGADPRILQIVSGDDNANGKLQLVTISPYRRNTEMTDLRTYMSNRISGVKNGTLGVNLLLEKYNSQCPVDDCTSALLDVTDSTLQTMQAVVALLNAFKLTHNINCSSQSGVCDFLMDSRTFYPTLLNKLRSSLSTASIGNLNVSIRFDEKGELYNETSLPAYSLNIVTNSKYEMIGYYYLNGSWILNNPSKLPNTQSRCQTQCEKCLKETPPYIHRRHRSEYIIAGTGPIYNRHDEHGCGGDLSTDGFVIMESFYFAVEKIREKSGIDFSTLFIDTCYANLGTHSTMNQIFLSDSEATLTDTDGKSYNFSPSKFVVFIGDYASGVSLALQTYLSLYNIPQISYFSTSTWLSDPLRYPLFLRNVPSDDAQAQFMIDIVKRNGWDTIGLINTDSIYGQTGAQLIIKYAKASGICIQYRYVTKTTPAAVSQLVQHMRDTAIDDRLPRPLIAFAERDIFKTIFAKIKTTDDKWAERGNFLIGSDTWNRDAEVISDAGKYAFGSLSFSFSEANFNWTTEAGENKFKQYLQSQRPDANKGNPLFLNFWQQYFECYLPDDPLSVYQRKCSDTLTLANPPTHTDIQTIDFNHIAGKYVVMAGLSVAYAIDEAYDEKICSSASDASGAPCANLFEADTATTIKDFFRLLRSTKIPKRIDSSQKERLPYLSNSGDGVRSYQVYNVINRDDKPAYKLVYNITDDEIVEEGNGPTFYYADGSVNKQVVDTPCPNCQCLEETSREKITDITSPTIPNNSPAWSAPSWLLPLLIIIILCVLLLLVIVIVVLCMRYRANTNEAQRLSKDEMSMQYVSPSGVSGLRRPDIGALPLLPAQTPIRTNTYQGELARSRTPSTTRSHNGIQHPLAGEHYLDPVTSSHPSNNFGQRLGSSNMSDLKGHPAMRPNNEQHYDIPESPPTSLTEPQYADRTPVSSPAAVFLSSASLTFSSDGRNGMPYHSAEPTESTYCYVEDNNIRMDAAKE